MGRGKAQKLLGQCASLEKRQEAGLQVYRYENKGEGEDEPCRIRSSFLMPEAIIRGGGLDRE
jgi:hypothetical protein